MKSPVLGLALALGLASAASADIAHGVWQTEPDDGSFAHVTLGPCANPQAVCGTITRTYRDGGTPYQAETIGRQIVIDMIPQGDGNYEGSVWRPSNDRIYIGRMAIDGDRMRLRGCVAGGLFCASQNWVRVQ
ncbi:DUF2147 domain-containing protein [Roseibacterium sp. SDUM158016]|jgi:uncharacterized protein (DUF2147 family)|uniref:DUF2147 domain-containing protein n=1 Tax=Roseicyclus sediminis TaxID=2980997 RepID=UPI0021CEEA04|nr:DUF2147 domain-containing protein [Roseibacterium sp. SDUM158016]MCU4652850.1 DUF2147 domain-containing protein [Roseibacterium sp. SDUM158016]